jgi:hypothetical protein
VPEREPIAAVPTEVALPEPEGGPALDVFADWLPEIVGSSKFV